MPLPAHFRQKGASLISILLLSTDCLTDLLEWSDARGHIEAGHVALSENVPGPRRQVLACRVGNPSGSLGMRHHFSQTCARSFE